MKSAIRGGLSLLIVIGIIIALWPIGQTGYARWSQSRLQSEWQQQARSGNAKTGSAKKGGAVRLASAVTSGANRKPAKKAKTTVRPLPPTRIIIPEADVDAVVVQGMDEASLRRGPGHEPSSALPGERGNCIIAGHRNVYGSYFYKIDELWPGSEIILRTPQGSYSYKVVLTYTVQDNDLSPYKPIDPNVPQLTILSCTLPHTMDRLIIAAQMDETEQAEQ